MSSAGERIGVVELDDADTVLCVDAGRETGKTVEVFVAERPQLPGEAFADRLDMSRTGHRQTKTALGPHREPVVLLVGQNAVLLALGIGERSKHEAVLHRRPPTERHRVKQCGHDQASLFVSGDRPSF